MTFEIFLAVFGFLLLFCLFANKISSVWGIPSLLVFLSVGMLAGQDGLGGIPFHDYQLTNYVGTIALAFILFAGGLGTDWKAVRPILFRGTILSTAGVALTAFFLFVCARYLFRLSFEISLLISVILSSTDAAAVFNALRSGGLTLKSDKLKALLEFESGSNDPMAVILSVSALSLLSSTEKFTVSEAFIDFIKQMVIGILCGYFFGKLALYTLKHIDLKQSLTDVLGISIVFLVFTLTQFLSGNGYLALYLCGIILGNKTYRYRKNFMEFYDSFGWVMQITMFLTLGLLVNPHELREVVWESLGICFCLMFIARPLAVAICLYKSGYTIKEQSFIFWAGLKGAVPIILATYPMMSGFKESQYLFNLIFFLVILSVLIQGKTLPILAKRLDLASENEEETTQENALTSEDIQTFKENMIEFLKETAEEIQWFFGKLVARAEKLVNAFQIKKFLTSKIVVQSQSADDDKTDAGE